jgi:hypothetical protein
MTREIAEKTLLRAKTHREPMRSSGLRRERMRSSGLRRQPSIRASSLHLR